MYKTKEIRWFFKNDRKPVRNWFEDLKFDVLEKRNDFYLNLKKDDVGVKIREGKVEVKHRIGSRARGCLNPKAWGNFEEYIKWSFPVNDDDALYCETLSDGLENWTLIEKHRMAAQLSTTNNGLMLYPSSQKLKSGCQVEYSEIRLKGERWYTFGMEWFGENQQELQPDSISDILGNTELRSRQSMGYAAFLSK